MKDLQQIAPNMQIMAHKDEAPYLDGRKMPIKLEKTMADYDNLPEERKQQIVQAKQIYEQMQVNFDRELQSGDVLPICGGIEILHTPGHTPGHMVVHLQESRILVCGDAVNITDNQITGPNPIHTVDMDLGLQSMQKIVDFPKTGLVAYHGGFLRV